MKRLIGYFLLVAASLNTGTAFGQWNLEKCPTTNALNAICLLNRNSGWIAGDNGTILLKEKGEWREYVSPTGNNLYSLSLVDKNNIWAVGAKGTIIHFDGKIWNLAESPTTKDLFSVSFRDKDNGVAVGALGTILLFEDGIWRLSESSIRGNLFSAVFTDKNDIWIGGGLECMNVPIMKLGRGKKGFVSVNSFDSGATISSISFQDNNNGWAAGSPGTLMYFNGIKWESTDPGFRFPSLRFVYFRSENNGIVVGYEGAILVRKDGSWELEKSVTRNNLNSAYIADSTFYAVGDKGTILSRSKGISEFYSIDNRLKDEKLIVFPNPCDDQLQIKLPSITDNTVLSISLIASNGNKIAEEPLKSGNVDRIYTLATKQLENGFYVLELKTKTRVFTGKIVVEH